MTGVTTRLAAYAICRQDDKVLLAHFVSQNDTDRHWTLPGGKVEHGEDPYDAVIREVAEETGYEVAVEQLLGVDSRTRHADWLPQGELHNVGIFYRVRIIGGHLKAEIGGSTDFAEWMALSQVESVARSSLVDIGLNLDRLRPADGHVETIRVTGMLRH